MPVKSRIYIAAGFVERMDRIFMRHAAGAQAQELWEDEPHPVRLFARGRQFAKHVVVHVILCRNEFSESVD